MNEGWLDKIWRGRRFEVVLALCGIILVGMGVFWWRGGGEAEPVIEILPEPSEVRSKTILIVDMAGAVVNPGIYRLVMGARVEEAIVSAGGLTAEADGEWVEKNLNRSAKLVDGMKIYIPRKDEIKSGKSQVLPVKSQLININGASRAELEELPGIGPVTAEKIMAGRPYMRLEELTEKKIVNQRVWEQIQDKIGLW